MFGTIAIDTTLDEMPEEINYYYVDEEGIFITSYEIH